jgi:NADH dehydrogenase
VPLPIVKAGLEAIGLFAGEGAFATWEEAELMEISMTTPRGTEDVEALGVRPRRMAEVLNS